MAARPASGWRKTSRNGIATIVPTFAMVAPFIRASSSFSKRYARSSAVATLVSSAGWNWNPPTRIHDFTFAMRSPKKRR